MSPHQKIIQLRELIAKHSPSPTPTRGGVAETGVGRIDEALDGGLWKGGIVELVGAARSSGGATIVRAMLRHAAANRRWAALIDGSDCFDPQLAGPDALSGLLWLRCRHAEDAMRSADMLLRDGNLPLVIIDLLGNPDAQLRKIASTSWYRLQRAVGPTSTALLVITPRALVPCADTRIELCESLPLAALEWEPARVWRQTSLRVTRKRSASAFGGVAVSDRFRIAEAG